SWSALVEDAITRSRAETVRGAADRSGSRSLFTSRISPETDELAAEAVALQKAVRQGTNATDDGVAARDSHTSLVLLVVMLVVLLVAIVFAVLITRIVDLPVRALMDRLPSLDSRCLQELTTGLEGSAEGDFTVPATPVTQPLEVGARDELGQL